MIKRCLVVNGYGSYKDRTFMFPGTWVETWVLMQGAGVWFLVDFSPVPDEGDCA